MKKKKKKKKKKDCWIVSVALFDNMHKIVSYFSTSRVSALAT